MNPKFFRTIDGILEKKCSIKECGWKPISEFSTNGKKPNGKQAYNGKCKFHKNEYQNRKYKNKSKTRKCKGLDERCKQFKGCGKLKNIEEFVVEGERYEKSMRKHICTDCYDLYLESLEILNKYQREHKGLYEDVLNDLVFELKTCLVCNYTKRRRYFSQFGRKNGLKPHCNDKNCVENYEKKSYEHVILKKCNKCNIVYRPYYFQEGSDECYTCKLADDIENEDAEIEEKLEDGHKRCYGFCKKILPITDMAVHTRRGEKISYRGICKKCYKLKNKDPTLVRNSDRLKIDNELCKNCSSCNEWLTENNFSTLNSQPDKLNIYCKNCSRIKTNQYRDENRERYRETERKRRKWRRDNDPEFHLMDVMRSRMMHAMKGDLKSDRTFNLIGCSVGKLREYIENQFRDGMTWENFGEWQVDHIKPCASFNLTIPEQQRKCFNYKNLQPLWANENRFKSDRTDLKPEDYMKGRDYDFFQKKVI